MKLIIDLNQNGFKLEIRQNGRAIDLHQSKYHHNLSSMLITTLDKLLKRNNIDIKSLKSYKIQGNLGQDSTSHKIAAAFVLGLKT